MTTASTEPAKRPESRHSSPGKAPQPLSIRLRRQTAIVARWLHIYLSMVSFAIVLFFAVTGLTLNHADAFQHGEVVKTITGALSEKEMGPKDHPDTLAMVEHIRNTDHVHGAVNTDDLRVDDDQVTFSFRGPGYSADTTVDRATRKYQVVETKAGFVAVINDLHKGRDSGKVWSWVIDASAVLLTLVSLTGLLLLFFIYKRRTSGLLLAGIATAVCFLLYRIWVP